MEETEKLEDYEVVLYEIHRVVVNVKAKNKKDAIEEAYANYYNETSEFHCGMDEYIDGRNYMPEVHKK